METMEANELKVTDLMVGDWVICYHPSRLKSFEKVSVGLLHTMQEQEYGHIKEDSPLFRIVDPIPLTPEILEKNGFNEPPLEIQKRVRFVVLCEEYQIKYSFNSYWFSIYKNAAAHAIGYPTFICAFQERIKYVHELQHALRLCKVDKEIVL